MKNDIEKLKADFEEKLQNAILENQVIDVLGDESLWVSIDGKGIKDKSKKSLCIRPDDFSQKLTAYQAGLILAKFPSTEKIKIDSINAKGLEFDYDLSTNRSYNDSYSTLHIWYFSGDYEVSFRMPVEPNKELNGYFADDTRKIDPIEIRTHYVVSRPGRRAADVRVPIKVFANGEYIKYAMGHVRSTSEWAIHNIIEALKDAYLKTTEL